jgi:hypothetical protein
VAKHLPSNPEGSGSIASTVEKANKKDPPNPKKQTKHHDRGWGHGSSSREPDSLVRSLSSNPSIAKKTKKKRLKS